MEGVLSGQEPKMAFVLYSAHGIYWAFAGSGFSGVGLTQIVLNYTWNEQNPLTQFVPSVILWLHKKYILL